MTRDAIVYDLSRCMPNGLFGLKMERLKGEAWVREQLTASPAVVVFPTSPEFADMIDAGTPGQPGSLRI